MSLGGTPNYGTRHVSYIFLYIVFNVVILLFYMTEKKLHNPFSISLEKLVNCVPTFFAIVSRKLEI
jgi:hypothetical protein